MFICCRCDDNSLTIAEHVSRRGGHPLLLDITASTYLSTCAERGLDPGAGLNLSAWCRSIL